MTDEGSGEVDDAALETSSNIFRTRTEKRAFDLSFRRSQAHWQIKRIIAAEETRFVYNAAGGMVAEYSTIVEPRSSTKISYLTTDHLGSLRINTDANGAVV